MAQLQQEREALSNTNDAAESRLTMEQAKQQQLAIQLKAIESENLRLKEDLAFFEGLLPADKTVGGLSIRRLTAQISAPNQLHYQMLVMQGAKTKTEFHGKLQFSLTVLVQGKSVMIAFPDGKTDVDGQFDLHLKHYQHIQGILTLPNGANPKTLTANILENGLLRTQQTIKLE